MGMEDYRFALEFRETLARLVKEEVERQRPRYRMATVVSFDRVLRKCTVTFPGDTTNEVVNMGSIQPMSVGQVVRVAGLSGDRYIDDVLGQAYDPGPELTQIVTYTASGTFVKADYPGMKALRIRVQAPGGGGGGSQSSAAGTHSSGGGGGGGGYAEKYLLASALGTSETVTIGAGGTGTAGLAGTDGGSSSFGAHAVAGGGLGGQATASSALMVASLGGDAGEGTVGDILARGSAGGTGTGNATLGQGGTGGAGVLGGGAGGTYTGAGSGEMDGRSGRPYGGGGGGAMANASGTGMPGGTANNGIIIVEVLF